MSTLEETWEELELDNTNPSGMVYKRFPGSICDLYAAIEKPSNTRCVFFEVPATAVPPGSRFPVASGFSVAVTSLKQGAKGRVRIKLQVADYRFRTLFSVMCSDIVRHLEGARDGLGCVVALVARLHEWQRFFGKAGLEGLGEEAQRGLFAELLFLRRHSIPCLGARAAIDSWTGPLGRNQDFQTGGLAIEVKSSVANPSVQLRVSNARQLDTTGLENLVLFAALLDARVGARPDGESLVDAVAATNEILTKEDDLAASVFNDRLLAVGYSGAHATRYAETTYSIRAEHFFLVVDTFPRIVEPNLIAGVGEVSYAIDLSACLPFAVNAGQVAGLLRRERGVS